MQPSSTGKSKIQPRDFLKPNESTEKAIDSCPRFGQNLIPRPNEDRRTKRIMPLLSENSRAALSLDRAVEYELNHGHQLDPKMDRKKIRRIVSNRLSAQRARVRKAKYVNELEKMVKHLESVISVLTARMEGYKEKLNLLLLQNQSLQRLLQLRLNEAKFSEIELEKNRMEVARLKEVEIGLGKNSHDSNEGGQQMQDLTFKPLITQKYMTLDFYENGLQKLGSKQTKMAPTKLPFPVLTPKTDHGEAEADQYLNLEG